MQNLQRYSVFCGLLLGMMLGACTCQPGPSSEKRHSDGTLNSEVPSNVEKTTLDGGISERSGTREKKHTCPTSFQVTMTSVKAIPSVYAVFCPPPTINGCYELEAKEQCSTSDSPVLVFEYDTAAKTYTVSHSGSIEDNSHGTLKTAADATQPDVLSGLPEKTKIKALFSGIALSFEFEGSDVSVWGPD